MTIELMLKKDFNNLFVDLEKDKKTQEELQIAESTELELKKRV